MDEVSGPQPISRLLSELISLRGLARVGGNAQLASMWREVAGEKVALQTKVLGIKRGVLHIAVRSAPLLAELSSFHKPVLLEAFRRQNPNVQIRDLKFRVKSDVSPG